MCRFPANESIADTIRRRYDSDTLLKVRRLEKIDFKFRKAKLDLQFLEECRSKSFIPKFLRFKTANKLLRTSRAYKKSQLLLLNQEIATKNTFIQKYDKELKSIKEWLHERMIFVDFSHVCTIFLVSNDKRICTAVERQSSKLINLSSRVITLSLPHFSDPIVL